MHHKDACTNTVYTYSYAAIKEQFTLCNAS